ncbi:MAG: hypothetical protein ABI663_19430 [Chryseolinea sp.]
MKIKIIYISIFISFFNFADAQNSIKSLSGYRDFLNARFDLNSNWKGAKDFRLNRLVDLSINKNSNIDFVIPLHIVVNKDTLICFFYTQTLKKEFKNMTVCFNATENLLAKSIAKFPKESIVNASINFDSIYQYMQSNIVVNSQNFDINKYLDSEISDFCCRPDTYIKRLELIYLFFVNGIIIREESATGRLYYVSF